MKHWRQIIFLLFLLPLVAVWVYAAVIPGIVVSNKVTTGNTANTHAVADTSELHGGYMQLQYSSELRDIPESRRKRGMLAYSHDTRSIYQLYSTPGHFWQRYNSGGGVPVDISGKVDKAHFSAYSAARAAEPTLTYEQFMAINNAAFPSETNPFATIDDIAAAGYTSSYIFCEDDITVRDGLPATAIGALTRNWHELERQSDGGAAGQHTATTTAYTELDRYATPALNTNIIPGGTWKFTMYAKLSAVQKEGTLKADIYRIGSNGAVIGTVLGTATSAAFTNTAIAAIQMSCYIGQQTGWTDTDRIAVVVSGKRGAEAGTLTWYHNAVAGHASIMESPVVLLHNQLQGLNQGNYLHLSPAEKAAYDYYSTQIRGKLDTSRFLNYSAKGRVSQAQVDSKLDTSRYLNYSATRSAATKGAKGDRGYDGRMGKTLTCSILDGTRAVTYDNAGLNPSPSTLDPYSAWLWEDGTLITEPHSYLTIFYEWFVPVNSHLTYPALEVDGMQVRRQVFEPGVLSNYSAGKNDYVKVFTRLSSSRFPFGSRPCDASVPVAVLKQGPKGLQGDVAQAVVTAPSVLGAFSSARIPSPLVLTPYSSNVAPLRINDANGNVKVYIDGLGYQHFRDANNYDVVRVQTDGTIAILKNNVEWLRVDGQTKQVKIIRNGSAVFEIYSTGKYKGPEGWSTNVSKTRNYTLANGFRGYTTASSGSTGGMSNPYTLPVAGQTFRSPSGTTRFGFYTSGRQTVRGSLIIY